MRRVPMIWLAVALGALGLTLAGTQAAVAAGTTTTVTRPTVLKTIHLQAPGGARSPTGTAEVATAQRVVGLIIRARGLAPNGHNAYAVWLTGPDRRQLLLGFDPTKVTGHGRDAGTLEAETGLPEHAARYTRLLITLETSEQPRHPGRAVLSGRFAL